MGHGGGVAPRDTTLITAGTRPGPTPAPIDPQYFAGFSYFLGPPSAADRSTLGANPAQARGILQALHSLLPTAHHEDNPRIPSGYTYLLQFIAHDLVDTTVPFWAAADAGIESRNMRGSGLQLDTLYGGGPTACPLAYTPVGGQPDFRTQLRLGRVGDAPADPPPAQSGCPFRDLPRLNQQAPLPDLSNFDDASGLFVADQRNDDGVILAQVTTLFAILHNAIANRLQSPTAQAHFAYARAAMLQMYYAIIRHDVLPRLLDDRVCQVLRDRTADSPDWMWQGSEIPLEFTHGAFRVGHAMARPFYVFNDRNTFNIDNVLNGPVFGATTRDPLPSNWIVTWSKFFELDGTPNYSLRLAVRQQLPVDFAGLLADLAPETPGRLTLRDWLSAATARAWRLDALLQAVSARYPTIAFAGTAIIQPWLQRLLRDVPAMADAKAEVRQHMAALTSDLPLPLYVLLEAELDRQSAGAHLGPFGSVLVGEVLFRRLAQGEAMLQHLLPGTRQAMGDADWQEIAKVRSMPDLVKLAAAWGGLADCAEIPFIA